MESMIEELIAHDPVTNSEAESVLYHWIKDHPETEDAAFWAEEAIVYYFSNILRGDGE